MNISILGLGARGRLYARIAKAEGYEIKAVCDTDCEARMRASEVFGVDKNFIFESADELFARGKLSDVLIVSTLDETHYDLTLKAIELGYDILLEKPIALKREQIEDIEKKATAKGVKIGVCHVLRYTPFYQKIKEIIDSGVIGEVMNIEQVENVGYFHHAHSFVRGNWHNTKETCPMILAKCCHDLDLIIWLSGKNVKRVSSFGELTYFKKESAPEGSEDNCNDCKYSQTCPYSAIRIYTDRPTWVLVPVGEEENVENAMKVVARRDTFYAKCVYRCDNDTVDHQLVNLELSDGVFAHLTMQAFSGEVYRRTQVCGTKGEINGILENNEIELSVFGSPKQTIKVEFNDDLSIHCGGDKRLFIDFMNYVAGKEFSRGLTGLDKSTQSHIVAFCAEESRLNGGKPVDIG